MRFTQNARHLREEIGQGAADLWRYSFREGGELVGWITFLSILSFVVLFFVAMAPFVLLYLLLAEPCQTVRLPAKSGTIAENRDCSQGG